MKTKFYSFLFLTAISAFAQNYKSDLYIPSEILKAYEKKTRSYDGKPGQNYWINKTKYYIKAAFNVDNLVLTGEAKIIYFNNSPDTLDKIVFRCYPDFYKFGNMRDWQLPKSALNDGMILKKIKLYDQELNISDTKVILRSGTNAVLSFSNKLNPKDSIEIYLQWEYQFPKERGVRMGVYKDSSYFVAYWYPQVAVYDDIYGWDELHYTGTTEFYNDFNDYEVEISVKNKFIVWATGECLNYNETLNQEFVQRLEEAKKSDKIINIVSFEDVIEGKATKKNNEYNVWKFQAFNVPDFAFAISSSYLWDATSAVVDSFSNSRALVFAVYDKDSEDFKEVAFISKASLEYFSHCLPGVPYPYPALTVFNGSGGMEYPMMANNGSFKEKAATVHVTTHEIFHNYFPFMMGTNERRFAFMDEGWAVSIPFDLQSSLAENYDPRALNVENYNLISGTSDDYPPIVQSHHLRWRAYRQAAYNRPSIAYDLLRSYLGEKKFKEALQEYIKRWQGKHPSPYDFFFTFNDVLQENLNWYWKKWFFEFCYPDLGIEKVELKKDKLKIEIKNIGKAPVPIVLRVYYTDYDFEEKIFPLNIWEEYANFNVEIKLKNKPKKIKLGSNYIPDNNQKNNTYQFKN